MRSEKRPKEMMGSWPKTIPLLNSFGWRRMCSVGFGRRQSKVQSPKSNVQCPMSTKTGKKRWVGGRQEGQKINLMRGPAFAESYGPAGSGGKWCTRLRVASARCAVARPVGLSRAEAALTLRISTRSPVCFVDSKGLAINILAQMGQSCQTNPESLP